MKAPPVIPQLQPQYNRNLRACQHCGAAVSKAASVCPHCGGPQPKRTSLFTWLVTLFLVIPGLSAIVSVLSFREAQRKPESPEQLAQRTAQREKEEFLFNLRQWSVGAVKAQLKAPSTAKFPGVIFGANEYKIYSMPDGAYRVFSWVDSQNSFGAMVRSKWMVEFKQSNGQWQASKVSVE